MPLIRIVACLGAIACLTGAEVPSGSSKGAGGAQDRLTIEAALVTVIEQVEVPARVEGVLAEMAAREGQLVAPGDDLARIDDTAPLLALKRARIELEAARRQAASDVRLRVARKGAEVAEAELRRARESIDKYKKSVSETELDRLRLSAEKAAIDIEQARDDREIAELTASLKETEVELAKAALDHHRIVSPLGGIVVQINQHRGEWVQPGKTVLRLPRLDRLRVEGLINVQKLSGNPMGRRATLAVDLPGRPATNFEGVVVFVSPEVNPVNGQVRIWAEVENREMALRPGLQGTLTVHPETAQAAKPSSR